MLQERTEKLLGRVESALQGSYEPVILQSASRAVAITDYVNATDAELVVLGTRKRSALGSHFLSTNAERLIQDAPVSVLAVWSITGMSLVRAIVIPSIIPNHSGAAARCP